MGLFYFIIGLAMVTAQRCNCDSTTDKGFYTGPTCNQCNPKFTDRLTEQGKCEGYSFCTRPSRPQLQRSCFGQGFCNATNTESKPCFCKEGQAGKWCERCEEGKVGWPSCTTVSCRDSDRPCSGQGVCSDRLATVSCGNIQYIPASQECFQLTDGGITTYRAVEKERYVKNCGNKLICGANQECFDENEPICCPKGNEACYDKNKKNGKCVPQGSTCCDGNVCNIAQTCVASINSVTVRWKNPYTLAPANPIPGSDGKQNVVISASNEWKTPDGKEVPEEERPRMCSAAERLSGPASMKVIMYPLFGMLGCILAFILVAKTTGVTPLSVGIPAILTVFCSICFCFTNKLLFLAYLLTITACVALGAAHKGGVAAAYAMVFQFLVLAISTDGFGLGILFVGSGVTGVSPYAISTAGSGEPSWSELTQCARYFGYFAIDPNNIVWTRPDDLAWGYCTEGWFTYQMFALGLVAVSQLIMLVGSGLVFLEGSPKA